MDTDAAIKRGQGGDPDPGTCKRQTTGVHIRLAPAEWDALHDYAIREDRALNVQAQRFIRERLVEVGALEARS